MQCEICGDEARPPKTIMLEGTRMNVCPRCSSHGTVVGGYGAPTQTRRRTRYGREEEFEIVPDYGQRIRAERERRAWKQEDLGRAINEPASTVQSLEHGKLSPTREMAKKLEKTLGITLIASGAEEKVEIEKPKESSFTLGDIVTIKKR